MSFKFIRDHAERWPIRLMCRVFEVSASGYYAWRSRPESACARANRTLLGDVCRLHAEHHGRYGSPRMHTALRAEGRTASRGRVERLMRRHGIRALAGRRFKPCTTDSRHYLPIAPNLLKQEFVAQAPSAAAARAGDAEAKILRRPPSGRSNSAATAEADDCSTGSFTTTAGTNTGSAWRSAARRH